LKQAYREYLIIDEAEVRLVYLKGDFDFIHERLVQRRGHFMPPGLLASQFAALEEPEQAIPIKLPKDQIPLVTLNPTEEPLRVARALDELYGQGHGEGSRSGPGAGQLRTSGKAAATAPSPPRSGPQS
jgi:hypothetical protein